MSIADEQKYANYQFLLKSIAELKSGRKPTEDWEQSHFTFFYTMRKTFVDFRLMSIGQDDDEFKRWQNNAEQLARYQEMHWESNGCMNYPAYLQLLEHVLMLADYGYNDEDDGLNSMMENLGMK